MKRSGVLIMLLFLTGFTVGSQAAGPLVINEFMASNLQYRLNPDKSDFEDWIELYNNSASPFSLNGVYITDDLSDPFKWPLPSGVVLEPGSCFVVWADGKGVGERASFKLSEGGEQIGLFLADGTTLDTLSFGDQIQDISYGRYPDGNGDWYYFEEPSPGKNNSPEGFTLPVRTAVPEFSLKGGLYTGEQSVSLLAGAGGMVHYTLDGSIPGRESPRFQEPVSITQSTVIRARVFRDGFLPSKVVTQSYIINESFTLPVISISIPPEFLFDEEIGITPGICVPDELGAPPPFDPNANFWNRWERPVHLEYFTPDGISGLDQDAGIALFGGMFGRQIRQKSFTLYARDKYGDKDFDFPLFPSKPFNSYRRFLLRCSSNDFNRTFIRDAMMNSLVIGQMDVDYQAYQPALVYLNGEFWGLYNIREKTNRFYPESNYGIDPDRVELIEGPDRPASGDGTHFLELLDFVRSHDMTLPENYAYVKERMDMVEFMNYYITEIYVCNRDWLHQNIKCWREGGAEGKWRWLLYDMDWGFSGEIMFGPDQSEVNMIQWVLDQGEASVLFRSLIENSEFRSEFVQRFVTHLNLTFQTERVHSMINKMQDRIRPEMPRQIGRWGAIKSMDYWEQEMEVLHRFAESRFFFMNVHLAETLMPLERKELILEVSDPMAGFVTVYDTPCPVPAFGGAWFRDLPIQVSAHALPGWRFVRWEGSVPSTEKDLILHLNGNTLLHAVFEPHELPDVLISEIHYNPSAELQGTDEEFEFVELVNREGTQVDIGGFQCTGGIEFLFEPATFLEPGECIILAKNANTYNNLGVRVFQISSGQLDNAGEKITLKNQEGELIDEVFYDDHYPWPRPPDGEGPSLELMNLWLDNSLASSWKASGEPGGSPGVVPSSEVSAVENTTEPSFYLKVWPNPFTSTIQIEYYLDQPQWVSIEIYNISGQKVKEFGDGLQGAGLNMIRWNPLHEPGGLYVIRYRDGSRCQASRVLYLGP